MIIYLLLPIRIKRCGCHLRNEYFRQNHIIMLLTLKCSSGNFFPWKNIWMAKVPLRVVFFMWTAALRRILIVDNLCKRHILIIDWCCLYKCSGESIDHLLLQCSIATNIWSFAFTWFRLAWVMLKSVLDLLECWEGEFQCHRGANMW